MPLPKTLGSTGIPLLSMPDGATEYFVTGAKGWEAVLQAQARRANEPIRRCNAPRRFSLPNPCVIQPIALCVGNAGNLRSVHLGRAKQAMAKLADGHLARSTGFELAQLINEALVSAFVHECRS
jgi:hypothetical protein